MSRAKEALVITGRGNNSPDGVSVVREAIAQLLASLRRRGVLTERDRAHAGLVRRHVREAQRRARRAAARAQSARGSAARSGSARGARAGDARNAAPPREARDRGARRGRRRRASSSRRCSRSSAAAAAGVPDGSGPRDSGCAMRSMPRCASTTIDDGLSAVRARHLHVGALHRRPRGSDPDVSRDHAGSDAWSTGAGPRCARASRRVCS